MLLLARSRSRRRRRSAGAAMFIVTVTLALLAVMGVYGLTATSSDIKSAGHIRERAQATHAAEYGATVAAEIWNTTNARKIVNDMEGRLFSGDIPGTQRCWSAKPRSAATDWATAKDELCYSVTVTGNTAMLNPSGSVQFGGAWKNVPFFTGDAIGSQLPGVRDPALNPFVKIEFTNPRDVTPPGAGSGGSGSQTPPPYTQLTVTVYAFVATPDPVKTEEPTRPYDEIFKARGYVTVPSNQ
jgi:hypothetical protein